MLEFTFWAGAVGLSVAVPERLAIGAIVAVWTLAVTSIVFLRGGQREP